MKRSLILLGMALAATAATAGDASTVLSVQDIDCRSCGDSTAALLERQEGVDRATFNRDSVEITVHHDPARITAEQMVEAIALAGYTAVAGAGLGRYLPVAELPDDLDAAVISRAGEEVDLREHLAPGKVTVFDFYAVWCGPCREVDAFMREILTTHDDVALRKLNVVDWSSPVARRYLTTAGGLPYVEVWDARGKRAATIDGFDLERLEKAIDKARRRR